MIKPHRILYQQSESFEVGCTEIRIYVLGGVIGGPFYFFGSFRLVALTSSNNQITSHKRSGSNVALKVFRSSEKNYRLESKIREISMIAVPHDTRCVIAGIGKDRFAIIINDWGDVEDCQNGGYCQPQHTLRKVFPRACATRHISKR